MEVDEKTPESVCTFEWDEESKLYFHASSGFYHEPNAGWYYSSREGLYYRFENGSYVPLESNKYVECKVHQCDKELPHGPGQDKICISDCITSDVTENPPPPSEWLEETLIDFYLTGYSNSELNADSSTTNFGANGEKLENTSEPQTDELFPKWSGSDHNFTSDETEGELICEKVQEVPESSGEVFEEDDLCDEERWQTQYGQVVHSVDDAVTNFPTVDLWDWRMVKQSRNKKLVARLVGRLVRRSTMLHPSMPAGGHLLRTAAICEIHLDLVRVASGKVYRLRSPSAVYLASLSAYDSSNPTKGWGFPDMYSRQSDVPSSTLSDSYVSETETSNTVLEFQGSSSGPGKFAFTFDKQNYPAYRDRAAERRILHGGFGVGPGQKNSTNDDEVEFVHTEEATAEAINLSFGAGSYARRILESMGWKEGEALGRTTKGLLEPLQAVGNKGNAGLGWNRV